MYVCVCVYSVHTQHVLRCVCTVMCHFSGDFFLCESCMCVCMCVCVCVCLCVYLYVCASLAFNTGGYYIGYYIGGYYIGYYIGGYIGGYFTGAYYIYSCVCG
eukprot:GHVR01138866.1.p1 GENE.GHVR01138866.1~~GHVR01138866.1.p1  ORF type:complete len:102 (+),score=42.90 GHVR01138866.1:87-392(+)